MFQKICTPYWTTWENINSSYIYFIQIRIIQLMRNNGVFLWSCIHAPEHTTRNPILRPSYTYTSPYKSKYEDTSSHTPKKFLPGAHNTPLRPHTIIHTTLFTRRTFTCTRKHLSQHKKTNKATSHFPQTRPVEYLRLVLYGVTGFLPRSRHW